jgi:hypothetical protein
MTEAEWDACADPTPMLEVLRGRASDRKLRLFAAACCRAAWQVFTDERSRAAVEACERFADGLASADALRAAWEGADKAEDDAIAGGRQRVGVNVAIAVKAALRATVGTAEALLIGRAAAVAAAWAVPTDDRAAQLAELNAGLARSGRLLRDLFGNPFRPAALDPAWLAWNGGAVRKMAESIYEERRFADLPVLADALEDAGCADAAVLAHCRGPGEHVRGCWVVDLLLGKA